MKYITAEQFLKADKKVQEAILDWWKPEIGDLFTTKLVYDEIDVVINVNDGHIYGLNETFEGNIYDSVDKSLGTIPLLAEGQLREFIEDKTGGKIDIEHIVDNNIQLEIVRNISGEAYKQVLIKKTYSLDLLETLWQVACKVIEKEHNI